MYETGHIETDQMHVRIDDWTLRARMSEKVGSTQLTPHLVNPPDANELQRQTTPHLSLRRGFRGTRDLLEIQILRSGQRAMKRGDAEIDK